MQVVLSNIAKRFNTEWILKKISFVFEINENYGIFGANGSGKSTLMKIIAGHIYPSKGQVQYFSSENEIIRRENAMLNIDIAAPYISPILDYNFDEFIQFHRTFKSFKTNMSNDDLYRILNFDLDRKKSILNYSSGMRQRILLLTTLTSNASLKLLDEPGSYLDQEGHQWYLQLLERFSKDTTIVISSNEKKDFKNCQIIPLDQLN